MIIDGTEDRVAGIGAAAFCPVGLSVQAPNNRHKLKIKIRIEAPRLSSSIN
jgi:hypothetical protein